MRAALPAGPDKSYQSLARAAKGRARKFSSHAARSAPFSAADNFRHRRTSQFRMHRRSRAPRDRSARRHRDDTGQTLPQTTQFPLVRSAKLSPPPALGAAAGIPSPKSAPDDSGDAFEKIAIRFVESIDLRAFHINHAQNAIVFVIDNGHNDL